MEIISVKDASRFIKEEANKKNISFLIGAGVSKVLPSSLPLGNDIKDSLIRLITAKKELNKHRKIIFRSKKYKRLIPELIFQPLYETLERKIYQAFDILNTNSFNHLHECIAWIYLHKGSNIYTTNFDVLIEQSSSKKIEVNHLHGAINRPDEMVIRIYQVGRGIPKGIATKFKKDNNGKVLVVLGYSGNDKDIISLINNTKFKFVLWLVRGLDDKWALGNITKLDKQQTRVFAFDLNYLFDKIIKHYKIPIKSGLNSVSKRKISSRRDEANRITIVESLRCIQSIHYTIGNYEEALQICRDVLNDYKLRLSEKDKSWFHQVSADNITCIGLDFREAVSNIKKAIKINLKTKSLIDLAESYNALGNIYAQRSKPNSSLALDYLEKSKEACGDILPKTKEELKKNQLYVLLGKIHNNMGLCNDNLKDYKSAIENYKLSIRHKRKAGNITAIAVTAANISLAYRSLNDYRYKYWKKKAEEIFKLYGLYYRLGYLYRELGIRTTAKNKTIRLQYLNNALTVYLNDVPDAKFDIDLTQRYIRGIM